MRDLRDEEYDDDEDQEVIVEEEEEEEGGGEEEESGGEEGGGEESGGGDDNQGGDDSGWEAVEDYEENGRTIRKFTDSTGTDYFQDVGEWSPRQQESDDNGDRFDWGDNQDDNDWMSGDREVPDVDPDIRDLHDYYHPYTVSKYEDDPVRKGWGDGVASDGTRFDQQDRGTQEMFGSSFGDQAARNWAEQRSRDLEAEYRRRGLVTLPRQQEMDANGQPREYTPTSVSGTSPAPTNPVLDLPRGSALFGQEPTPGAEAPATIPDYVPPAIEAPAPTPPAGASPPQPQSAAPPPAGQQAAADAAARATAQAGGSPQQVADAAAAAALSYDRRNLTSESPETQRQFQQAYGEQADERWVQQHNQELALNRALYGTAEPRAGAPQTGAIPGLGNVGPAPDRTIGQAQPAPWNRPVTAPGAAGVPLPSPGTTPGAVSAVTSTTHGLIDDILQRPSQESPPTTGVLTPSTVSAATSTTQGLINDILQRPAAPPNPNIPSGRGPTAVPSPLTAAQAAAYERGGVNPATGDIDIQATPESYLPGASPVPSDSAADILTIRNGNGEVRQEPRWAWDQRGELGQQVWEVVNAEGAPTQTLAEAGFERTSAVGPIDASIRTAANVPVPFADPRDLDAGAREAPRVGELRDPFGMLIQRAAEAQGATDIEGFGRNVAAGITAREAWAEPYVNDLARAAWYRESRGLEGGPQNAPTSYIEDWKGAFLGGDMSVPGVAEVSDEMRVRGVPTPSDLARAAEVRQVVRDWRGGVARLNQNLGTSYSNPANAAAMAEYACGAASFATAVNAVNPDANLRVDDAMAIINRGGRNLINPAVGLTLGSDLSAMAPAFNEAGVNAEARNFTPQTVQQHFADGGGPIVFSGPGWGRAMGVPSVPAHIYTATNADANGVTIVDSSGSNRTRMTWDEWQGATGGPARGAGISAVPKSAPSPGAAVAATPAAPPTRMQSPETVAPNPSTWDAPTEPQVRALQDRVMAEAPVPPKALPAGAPRDAVLEAWSPFVEWVHTQTGAAPDAIMGLILTENGGTDQGPVQGRDNNLFSVKWNPGYPDRFGTPGHPAADGGRFVAYPSTQAAAARWLGLISHPDNKNYAPAWRNRRSADGMADGLITGGYLGPHDDKAAWRSRYVSGAAQYRDWKKRSGR